MTPDEPTSQLSSISTQVVYYILLVAALWVFRFCLRVWTRGWAVNSFGIGESTISNQDEKTPQSKNRIEDIISKALLDLPSGNCGQWGISDFRLTVEAPNGLRVPMEVHREVLVSRSNFFAKKLGGSGTESNVFTLKIHESDDLEVYVEALVLMYSEDLKTKLAGREVSKLLHLLKVCLDILFDDGYGACLEHLEGMPGFLDLVDQVLSRCADPLLHDATLSGAGVSNPKEPSGVMRQRPFHNFS